MRIFMLALLGCGLCLGQAANECKPSTLNVPGAVQTAEFLDGVGHHLLHRFRFGHIDFAPSLRTQLDALAKHHRKAVRKAALRLLKTP